MNNMKNSYFTIAETADFFSVSTATIRNWIKTGYINLIEKGKVDKQSVFAFKANKLGKEKLTGRANKSQKDSHNHSEVSKLIYQSLENDNLDHIGKIYENNLSDSYRNKEGIYYTPENIFGIDIDPIAVDITKKRIKEKTGNGV